MLSEQVYGENLADCWFAEIKTRDYKVCKQMPHSSLTGQLARESFLKRLGELFQEDHEEWLQKEGARTTKSESLERKIEKKLSNFILESADVLLDLATSGRSFESQADLRSHIVEGAILNVNGLAANNLSIPSGKYVVWANNAKHTTLVPIKFAHKEVFENHQDKYDLFTSNLIRNWNYLERILAEDDEKDGEEIDSNIDMSTVDRDPIVRSMEQQGHTVTSLAKAVGVLPPAISRILRIPKRTKGDPGGRNPSIGLAARIANELKMNPEALFPDIFGTMRRDLKPRKPPANTGSGMKQAAKGSTKKGGFKKK